MSIPVHKYVSCPEERSSLRTFHLKIFCSTQAINVSSFDLTLMMHTHPLKMSITNAESNRLFPKQLHHIGLLTVVLNDVNSENKLSNEILN